jgi:predicted nucleotidyltransferase
VTAKKDAIRAYRLGFQARLKRQQEEREQARQRALQAVQEKALEIIAHSPSVRRAYLFGSLTRPGAFHHASDIDVAVEGTTAQDYFALWKALEEALPDWVVDLRDVTSPSPFSDLVRRTGVLIYERTDSTATG